GTRAVRRASRRIVRLDGLVPRPGGITEKGLESGARRADEVPVRLRHLLPILGLLAALMIPAPAGAAEVGLNMNGGAASATPENFAQLTDVGATWARHFLYWD